MRRTYHCGFTLIELSIVLVIVGLLVGGVLSGRDLIRAAQHRKMISEIDGISTAVRTFYDKYNCLPGDCFRATRFWGTGSVGSTQIATEDCHPTVSTTSTCDGNGNGAIDHWRESSMAWQHLSLAKLVAGQWPGVGLTGGAGGTPGVHIPPSAIAPAGYQMYDMRAASVNWYWYGGASVSGNNITCGGFSADVAIDIEPFLTAAETLRFDSKFDDGNVQSGSIRGLAADPRIGLGPSHCNDTTTSDNACALIFLNRLL